MNAIQLQLTRPDAVGAAGAGAATRGLKEALMVVVVAIAALASAIVLVLIPQPIPYPSPQVPLACSAAERQASPEVAMVGHTSRVARSTDDKLNSRCA